MSSISTIDIYCGYAIDESLKCMLLVVFLNEISFYLSSTFILSHPLLETEVSYSRKELLMIPLNNARTTRMNVLVDVH